jgi:serine/threonine protein kinase
MVSSLQNIRGKTLNCYLKDNGPMNETTARHFFRQLVAGVEYCHSKV